MSQAVHRRLAALGVAVGLGAVVTACGSQAEHPSVAPLAQLAGSNDASQNGIAELAPDKALDRAIEAMEETGSYRVNGTTTSGNTIDLAFKVGVGSAGTIDSGNPMQLVSADGSVYVSGDAETMEALVGADVDETIADKWLPITEESTANFEIFSDGATFADAVLGAGAPTDTTGVEKVEGELAVGLVFPETGGTLWVAANGEPLPLRFEEKGASAEKGILTFSDFGGEVDVSPPSEGELLDTAQKANG